MSRDADATTAVSERVLQRSVQRSAPRPAVAPKAHRFSWFSDWYMGSLRMAGMCALYLGSAVLLLSKMSRATLSSDGTGSLGGSSVTLKGRRRDREGKR